MISTCKTAHSPLVRNSAIDLDSVLDRVSPSREPVFSFAHYFQAPATPASVTIENSSSFLTQLNHGFCDFALSLSATLHNISIRLNITKGLRLQQRLLYSNKKKTFYALCVLAYRWSGSRDRSRGRSVSARTRARVKLGPSFRNGNWTYCEALKVSPCFYSSTWNMERNK